jgi:hypothetical protein
LIKKAIQDKLHADFTFQSPDSVLKASKMLGMTEFWSRIAENMAGTPKAGDLQERLRVRPRSLRGITEFS